MQVAATALGGRDFEGQVTKKINGKTYILIGNEQQLRAIGSGKKVIGRINKVKQTCTRQGPLNYQWVDGTPSSEYAGDADLSDSDTLRDADASDHDSSLLACTALIVNRTRTKYYGVGADGTQTDYSAANTGLTYSADADYLIFRNIDLSKNAADTNNTEWTPLMFSGTMLGAVSNDGDTAASLWKAVGIDGESVVHAFAARPVISHVVVNQKDMVSNVKGDQLDVSKQQGIGFFASITNKTVMNSNSLGSVGTAVVSNLKLQDVSVANHTSESYIPPTLLGMLTSAVGLLLDALLKALKLLTFGQVDLDLNLQGLLTLHKDNPSNLATGAFAGRIYGDTKVTDCEVADVSVSSVSRMTGGFVGYVEGATRYDAVSGIVGALTKLLSGILNIIPFLGLGDLVDWLLSGTLGLNALIPVGYYNPVISNSSVNGFKNNVVIGNKDNPQAGGFVGAQIGAIIENSSVTSTNGFTVRAKQYAGGFAGVSRNGNVGGLINSLGVDLLSALRPQSLIENSRLTVNGDDKITVQAEDYAGGFNGAMANAYAVNNSITASVAVTADKSHAGGFTGFASVGWGLELGTDDTTKASLLKQLTKAVTKLLSGSNNGAGELLSIVGVNPSAILGTQMKGSLTVAAGGDYAGGLVGEGSGTVIGDSSQNRLQKLTFWKYNNPRDFPQQRSTTIEGLESVTATGSYAGGIAGNLQPTTVAGLLNSVVKIGDIAMLKKFDQFAAFTVENMSVTAPASGLTVKAGSYYAGGAIGCATGGDVTHTNLTNLATVSAKGEAGGFIGFSGPGDAIGAGGLNVLGLIKLSGLLSVAQYSSVAVTASNVNGISGGFTVAATGKNKNNETTDYAAGGFYGQANSTKTRESHVTNLKSVTADTSMSDGVAGGFVGFSTTGGLADALSNAEDSSVLDGLIKGGLLSVNDLLGAVPYLIPSYTDTTVTYVNGGYVEGDIAGGYAGNFQSGKVNQFSETDLKNDSTLAGVQSRVQTNPVAVVNLDHVTGGAYAGGFGGKVVSGALASAGNGGLSLLGKFGTVDLANLLQVVQGYVPFISYAGVHSDATTVEATSGNRISDPDDPGFTVSATRFDQSDTQSGSAGGYIGYGSGVQVSHSSVTQLRHTDVKAPKNLETAGSINDTYLSKDSTYAVTAARYAGGYIGKMDIGSAAAVGGGLRLLGQNVNLNDVLSVLDVVVSTIEHSDVTGGIGGYSVLASTADHRNANNEPDPLGMAGGFAGDIEGGHIQDSSSHEFVYIIGQVSAGGYVGAMQPGAVANVLGDGSVLKKLVNLDNLLSLVQDFTPTIRNSSTDAAVCGGAVRAQAASDTTTRRGMAGGYAGRNRGGHIWGNNTAAWKQENTDGKYNGPKRVAYAARIRSVYGAEIAGGYTGFMEAADTAQGGSLSLLGGLIKAGNLAGVLSVVYPTEEHSKVTGPLRNMSYDQWKTWVDNIGKYGAYGKEFTEVATGDGAGSVTDQDSLDKFLESYIFGFNVVAGRAEYQTGANLHDSGAAGGHVGLMRTGTITDGQSMDVKTVSAMRAAGGYAGTMESGSASSFGSIQLFGDKGIKLDLGQMLDVAQVFVPVVKSSSVAGYRKGMKVVATGEDITHGTGNAGGYVGLAVGGQIWGDLGQNGQKLVKGVTAAGANVSNLRKVEGRNNVGGFIGVATAGAVADVDTNASEGFLQGILDSLVSNPASLVSVLQATVTTIRGAHVSSDDPAWGYTVNGAYESKDDKDNTTTKYALNAGGFAGSLQAAILGDKDSAKGTGSEADPNNDPASLTVNGLRAVEGGQYAGGFFGLADISSVASVGGGEAGDKQNTNLLLKLLKVGNVGVLEAFRTFIYDGQVNGVSDGIQIVAHDSTTKGMLDSKRYTGAAGGFGGGLINGSVKQSAVTNLNSVTGVNYVGGFIGHLGKSGTVAADNAQLGTDALNLLGATAGVLDIWGSHVGDSRVIGIPDGYTVTATHHGDDYGKATDKATGREVAGGFVGYVDLARVKGCTSDNLKKVTSGEIAGGFVGETSRAYLVDAKVNSVLVELLLHVVNALVKLLYLDKAQQVGVIDLGKWFPSIFGKVFDLKVLSEGNVLYVNLFGLKVSVALSKADAENQQQTDVAIVTIGDSVIKLPCNKNGIDMNGSGSNLTVQLIKGNRTRVEQSTVTGIASGYDVFGGGATQDTGGVKDLSTGYTGGFAGLNDEGVLADDHMVYADTIRGASGLVDPFSNTKLKSVWDFNTMSDILGPVDDGHGGKAYNTYRIYRKAAANASEARTSAQDGNKIFSQKNTADDALNTGLDRWEVKLFDVVNTYDSSAVHSSASGDAGTTWVGIKDAVVDSTDGSTKTKLDAYQSPAKAVLMLDATVTDNNGGLTPEPDDGQDPCGKDGCRTIDLTVQKVWKDGNLERPQSVELKIAAHYTDGSGNTVTPQTIQCFGADCTTVTQRNPWTVTLDSSDASSWSNTWRKVIQGLPVAFVDGQDANGKDIVRYYTYTVEETAVTYKDGDTTKTIKPAEAGYQVSVSYNTKERVATVTNAALLPDTGGAGTMWFLMFGLLLMGAGVVWYLRNQRVQSGTVRSGSSRIRKRGAHAS
ncbi:LPXTG cell wall anchor domain-containing protein [Bifidobacterium bifidum]|uniref:LPXTG cell wall anchor domain-containing protein n=1 Tax=Bifidobacterium bifidum TaxID=1681 RepID=UPI003CFFE419